MNTEERIIALQKELDDLREQVKNGNGMFKRVETGIYYTVKIEHGKAEVVSMFDYYDCLDNKRFDDNNYFLTEERAKDVAEKINTLLKMERIHDMVCPDYKPDWSDEIVAKCDILTHISDGKMLKGSCYGVKSCVETYFPEDKIEEAIELYKSMK